MEKASLRIHDWFVRYAAGIREGVGNDATFNARAMRTMESIDGWSPFSYRDNWPMFRPARSARFWRVYPWDFRRDRTREANVTGHLTGDPAAYRQNGRRDAENTPTEKP